MVLGFNHAQISAPPNTHAEVRRFYGEVLRLPEIQLPPAISSARDVVWFKVGDQTLHVAFEDGVNRLATRTHLAYEVDDIADCRQRFGELKIELIDQPKLEGYDRFHIHDPFGNRIEIIGRE